MTIYYSPSFTGHIYIDFAQLDNGLAFDCCYKNTEGLMDLLATFLGVHQQEHSAGERLTKYYAAFAQYIEDNPDCIFAASFSNAALATAQECLRWRDELTMYGWNADTPAPSERLRVLAGVERLFDCPGKGEFYSKIVNTLAEHKDVLKGSKIVVPFSKKVMQPMVRNVLEMLSEGGCVVEFDETKHDYSTMLKESKIFEVWEFETEQEALQYLCSLSDNSFDVWANHENHLLDTWLHKSGNKASGSVVEDKCPPIYSLLTLGMKMHASTPDVCAIVQWLRLPQNPLGGKFRYKLAESIISTGGYFNDQCEAVIEEYCDDKKELRFLPAKPKNIKSLADIKHEINTNVACKFTTNLMKWAKKTAHLVDAEKDSQALSLLTDVCESLLRLLDSVSDEALDCTVMEGWLSSLTSSSTNTLFNAQAGCRDIVSNYAAIAGNADKVILCDVYDNREEELSCPFLTEQERKDLLSIGVSLWEKESERSFRQTVMFYPFVHTNKQLVAVACKKRGCQPVPVHPLMIWAKGVLGEEVLKNITQHKTVDKKYIKSVPVVDNLCYDSEITINNASMIVWPEHESPSSLENMIDSPLDYTIARLTKFYSPDSFDDSKIRLTKGNVAHRVIEILFSPRDGQTNVKASEIKHRIEQEFDKVLFDALLRKGGLLLQEKNLLDTRMFAISLHKSVGNLAEIIENNDLAVIESEYEIDNANVGISSPDGENVPLKGKVDLLLQDASGSFVVFDHKWREGGDKKYREKIQNGTAYQLALYEKMIAAKDKKKVDKYGYFIMPQGVLYTSYAFAGKHISHIKVKDKATDAFNVVRDNYAAVRQQIQDGTIKLLDEKGKAMKTYYSKFPFIYNS